MKPIPVKISDVVVKHDPPLTISKFNLCSAGGVVAVGEAVSSNNIITIGVSTSDKKKELKISSTGYYDYILRARNVAREKRSFANYVDLELSSFLIMAFGFVLVEKLRGVCFHD